VALTRSQFSKDVDNDIKYGRRRIVIQHADLARVTPEMLAWWFGQRIHGLCHRLQKNCGTKPAKEGEVLIP